MKKILVLVVFTVLGFTNANAQKINFGVKAGFNIASINGDNTSNLTDVTSLHFGLVTEIPISEKFSFQPELIYSGQGFGYKNTPDKDLVALTYLNLPLMGKYYITKGLSIEAGPQIGYLVDTNNAYGFSKDKFKKVDFAANLGVGYKLQNGINFNARYNLGLSNINNTSENSDKFRNGVIQVSVGYFFF